MPESEGKEEAWDKFFYIFLRACEQENMNKILSKVERLTRSGGIYLIFREESIFSRFNFYYIILNVDAFQTRKLLMCFFDFLEK